MKKHILPLFLVICMLLTIMVGCAAETTPETTEPTAQTSEPAETTETPETEEAPAASESAEPAEPAEPAAPVLPLVEETTTLSLWWGGFDGGNFGNESPGATLVSQELEKRTNVVIDYIHCSGTAATEMRNLMYASEEYADMIMDPSSYVGGLEKGYEDEVYIDLTEYLEEYAPNYYALINSNEANRRIVTTDGGYQLAFYQVYSSPSVQGSGLIIREDQVSALGMELPVTYDDWTRVLTAAKSELGISAPMSMGDTGMLSNLMSGFGLNDDWFQVDGQAKYGPAQESFKDYLTLMNQWYNAGLISQDFAEFNNDTTAVSMFMNGQLLAVADRASCCTDFMTSIEGSNFVGIADPVVNVGDELHFYTGGNEVNGTAGIALTTQCSNIQLCMAWMDYLYSEEGSLLNSYGVEGESYTVSADGTYEYTDLLLNNPEGLPLTLAKLKYLDGLAGGTGLYDPNCEIVGVNENSIACDAAWKNDGAYVLPSYELSVEEGEEFSLIMSDIETYVSEMTLLYITGAESLDTFDTYLATIESLNIARAAELKQAGLDRYNSR